MSKYHESKTELLIKAQKMYSLVPPKNKVCPGIRSIRIPATPVRKTSEKMKQHFHETRPSIEGLKPTSERMQTTFTQGAVEIHLSKMYISNTGVKNIRNKLESGAVLKLSWKFFTFERSTTNAIRPDEGNIELGMTFFYKIDLKESFITFANTNYLNLELKGLDITKEIHLAKGKVPLTGLLDSPNEQLLYEIEIVDSDEAELLDNTTAVIYYGKVSLWLRLVCTEHHVNNLKSRTAPTSIHSKKERKKSIGKTRISQFLRQAASMRTTDPKEDYLQASEVIDDSSSSGSETDSDIENFQEALDLVLTRNKALRITQSEIAAELRERSKWLHEEYNWKRTLQEYDILRGEDPHLVQWRQWRDKDTSSLKLRRYSSIEEIHKKYVKLNIHYLEFYRYTADWTNFPPIDMLYVECKFLTFEGEEMSTKSLPVNKQNATNVLKFNFSKSIDIDVKKNENVCKLLADAIQSKDTVKFNLMSEPFEDLKKVQCAFKIGVTETSLFDLVQRFEDKVNQVLKITQIGGEEDEIIAKLHISFEGVQAMRAVALQILSPPDLMASKFSIVSTQMKYEI